LLLLDLLSLFLRKHLLGLTLLLRGQFSFVLLLLFSLSLLFRLSLGLFLSFLLDSSSLSLLLLLLLFVFNELFLLLENLETLFVGSRVGRNLEFSLVNLFSTSNQFLAVNERWKE